MRFDDNSGGSVNYEPNSFAGPVEDPRVKEPPLRISGDAARYDHREGNDDFTQPGNLYRLLPQDERERLHAALAKAMQGVPREIIERQLGHFEKAVRLLEKALAYSSEDPIIYDHLGDAYAQSGNAKKAVEYWRKALALDPNLDTIKAKIENLSVDQP